jgi:hypothetical protein
VRRKLNIEEKRRIQAERYKIERATFPSLEIEVVAESGAECRLG